MANPNVEGLNQTATMLGSFFDKQTVLKQKEMERQQELDKLFAQQRFSTQQSSMQQQQEVDKENDRRIWESVQALINAPDATQESLIELGRMIAASGNPRITGMAQQAIGYVLPTKPKDRTELQKRREEEARSSGKYKGFGQIGEAEALISPEAAPFAELEQKKSAARIEEKVGETEALAQSFMGSEAQKGKAKFLATNSPEVNATLMAKLFGDLSETAGIKEAHREKLIAAVLAEEQKKFEASMLDTANKFTVDASGRQVPNPAWTKKIADFRAGVLNNISKMSARDLLMQYGNSQLVRDTAVEALSADARHRGIIATINALNLDPEQKQKILSAYLVTAMENPGATDLELRTKMSEQLGK